MTSAASNDPRTSAPAPEPPTAPEGIARTGGIDAAAEKFRRDGVACLEGVFSDWVEVLRDGVARNMRTPGPYTKEYEPEGSEGYFFGDYCNWARIPEYREFVLHSNAAELAARLMDSATARFFHEHVLVKEPRTESRTPWHHDLPYYCIDGTQTVSFWTPLDPVPRSTCLELVVGSHRWGKSFLPKKFIGVDYEREGEALDAMPDIDARREELEIASFDMAPGDAIAFHFLTVHGAPGNASASARRRAFAHRWVGDDVRFRIRGGEVSPPFPEVHRRLRDGDPLDDPGVPARVDGEGLSRAPWPLAPHGRETTCPRRQSITETPARHCPEDTGRCCWTTLQPTRQAPIRGLERGTQAATRPPPSSHPRRTTDQATAPTTGRRCGCGGEIHCASRKRRERAVPCPCPWST